MTDRSQGVLRQRWSATVDDYAIAGGWARGGKALVVGDAAGSLRAFKGRSGEQSWIQESTHDGGLLSLAIRPGGSELATSGPDGRVLIWDVATGQSKQTINVGDGWVENLAWSPTGDLLAASCGRRVCIYQADGEPLWHSKDHPSTVSTIAWSRKGELATTCYGRVTFFNGATGKSRQKLTWKGSLVSLALSPDGDIVACGSQDNSVHFWRRSSGEDSMMSGYRGKPSALAFDDSGTLLATGGGDAVTVWSFANAGPEGTRPGVLSLHSKGISTLAFARKSMRLASGCRDGVVVLWTLRSDGEGDPIGVAMLPGKIASLFWRPDGKALAALDAEGGVTVWRVE